MAKSSKKIVKCKICEKNITTQSQGKFFRHCGTYQSVKDSLISDLSTINDKKNTQQKAPSKENNASVEGLGDAHKSPSPSKPKEIKEEDIKKEDGKDRENPKEREDGDDWGYY